MIRQTGRSDAASSAGTFPGGYKRALPPITGALTLTGLGASNLTIRRDPGAGTNFRIFDITTGAAPQVTITGVTLTSPGSGYTSAPTLSFLGAGITNTGKVSNATSRKAQPTRSWASK